MLLTELSEKTVLKLAPRRWSLDCAIVYGPIASRRCGLSLGINLLPGGSKVCNFDCLYCQCGWTPRRMALNSFAEVPFPSLEQIEREVGSRFEELGSEAIQPETIVFSGNGEPTLHPAFPQAARLVTRYRDEYLPGVRIGILTNGTRAREAGILEAIAKMDVKSFKLDAGLDWLDRPIEKYSMETLISVWRQIPNLTIQSFFSEGRFDNTRPEIVGPWIEKVRQINPRRVHIYTLDRIPAVALIQRASLSSLTRIGRQLANVTGIEVDVFD
jgi:wyosine [tRNA(Phe)-imidazoG37] synthetase (radical SAM superfamily)